MPRKIRQLIRDLHDAGFVEDRTNGSYRVFEHPLGPRVTLSGAINGDAQRYQEKDIRRAIQAVEEGLS